jgi:hypothetical protein
MRRLQLIGGAVAAIIGAAEIGTAASAVRPAFFAPAALHAQTPATSQAAVSDKDLAAAINTLGAFDFPTRMASSRTVRRAPAAQAVPALTAAAKSHADSYVQYRALVLLAGFDDPGTSDVMLSLMGDRNDRLRAVAYAWFAHHPSPSALPALIAALPKELSEFVRPSLTRAIAAQGSDARAQAAIRPLITGGEDFFRGEVIQAAGDYRLRPMREAIAGVAKLDGPLQDDAVLALGRLGDSASLDELAQLQRTVPRERQPAIAAAICLLGVSCDAHHKYLHDTLRYAADTTGFQILLRATARALGALAGRGDQAAMTSLWEVGIPAAEASRAPIALALGEAAVRSPAAVLRGLAESKDQDAAILLLRDAFDMLEEDFEEELFYVEVRHAYWAAPEGSPERRVAEAVIQKLEF